MAREGTAAREARRSSGRSIQRSHRRRYQRYRRAITGLAVAVGFFALLALAMPWRGSAPSFRRTSTPAQPARSAKGVPVAPQPRSPVELEIGEASLSESGGARRIRGIVRNKDRSSYSGIEIVFSAWDRHNEPLGLVKATISEVDAGATASFQTETVPTGTTKYALRTLDGKHR